ncbi:MAG: signal peptidase I [Dehalococcoidia bacterium]|nr:signal peptidase I [Dehalococcoidia bacterium]MDW8119819.1 signal peptidase I [Chloroflexota bacterium]
MHLPRFSRMLGGMRRLLAFLRARRVVVRGWSMAPTLLPGDYLLVDTSAYRSAPPQRGDIVVVRDPHHPHRLLVKRVVALPGEKVEEAGEGVLRPAEDGNGGAAPGPRSWTLGEGEYFLRGDGEPFSRDSRVFGPVRREAILGRAWLVYWPLHRWQRLG